MNWMVIAGNNLIHIYSIPSYKWKLWTGNGVNCPWKYKACTVCWNLLHWMAIDRERASERERKNDQTHSSKPHIISTIVSNWRKLLFQSTSQCLMTKNLLHTITVSLFVGIACRWTIANSNPNPNPNQDYLIKVAHMHGQLFFCIHEFEKKNGYSWSALFLIIVMYCSRLVLMWRKRT